MNARALFAAVLVATLGPACAPRGRTTSPPHAGKAGTTPARDGLRVLADRVDPGPQQGLLAGIPSWAEGQFQLAQRNGDVAALHALIGQWNALPPGTSNDVRMQLGVEMGLAVLAVEHDVTPEKITDPEVMNALVKVYGMFDMPQLFDRRGLFGTMLDVVGESLARSPDGSSDARRSAELIRWIEDALSRLPALHRRMVARMLRETPTAAGLPDALDGLANASRTDPALALDLRRQSIALRGKWATREHFVGLATACYVALEPRCGDEYAAKARAATEAGNDKAVKDLAELDKKAALAQTVAATAADRTVDGRLAHARAVLDLGRHEQAREEFAALQREFPADARALAGYIDSGLLATFDVRQAYEDLMQGSAAAREHHDRRYLEISVGVQAMHLAQVLLPQAASGGIPGLLAAILPAVEPIRRDTRELAAQGVDVAVVLAFLFDLGEELLPLVKVEDYGALVRAAQELLPRAVALRAKLPNSPHAVDLVLAAAQFSRDRQAAIAAVAQPLPEVADANLRMRQAMTLAVLAMTFDDADALAAARKLVEAWPATVDAKLAKLGLARIDAVAWRMRGDAAARDRAIAAYAPLLVGASDKSMVVDLCNLSVLLREAGKSSEADGALAIAGKLDAESQLVMALLAVHEPVDAALLAKVADGGEAQSATVALAWMIHRSASKAERAALRKRIAELGKGPQLRARAMPTRVGLGVESSLQFGVGYSTVQGLVVNIDAGPVPKLFVVPPAPAKK